MSKPVVIVHFQPLEKYPPIINQLRNLSAENKGRKDIYVISTQGNAAKKKVQIDGINIYRVAELHEQMGKAQRILLYIRFIVKAFLILSRIRPGKILYYETLSAGAPCIYRFFNKKCELYIHYHEYTSKEEYQSGMVLNRMLHKLERKFYKKASWVSQTNRDRMNFFLQDCGEDAPSKVFILPNYPPAKWRMTSVKRYSDKDTRTGFVYVGALSLETMYVKEFAKFVASIPEKCYWDIYSDNFAPSVLDYLESLKAENIRFKGGLEYDIIPEVLQAYQVGVILYKGHIPNYVYNAPNKLFEYLACDLDVWVPADMKSALAYATEGSFPKTVIIDFNSLNEGNFDVAMDRRGLVFKPSDYYCEKVLPELNDKLLLL